MVQEFKNQFTAKYNREPGFIEAQAYDAVKIAILAIERGGATGLIQKAMADIKGYHGVTGEISFDENGDVAKESIVKTIKDGRFVAYEK